MISYQTGNVVYVDNLLDQGAGPDLQISSETTLHFLCSFQSTQVCNKYMFHCEARVEWARGEVS